ncbi:MAG: hypothetical protein KatS3mg087_0482 [Patescibacteria group bacterium]|nr:MAG: hypothetical protein KatS3mg087_0482 [Patescibacteria group bacterium]
MRLSSGFANFLLDGKGYSFDFCFFEEQYYIGRPMVLTLKPLSRFDFSIMSNDRSKCSFSRYCSTIIYSLKNCLNEETAKVIRNDYFGFLYDFVGCVIDFDIELMTCFYYRLYTDQGYLLPDIRIGDGSNEEDLSCLVDGGGFAGVFAWIETYAVGWKMVPSNSTRSYFIVGVTDVTIDGGEYEDE